MSLGKRKAEYFTPFKLFEMKYEKGWCKEAIESCEDTEEREILRAEYDLFTGNYDKALIGSREFLDSDREDFEISAWMIYIVSNMALENTDDAKVGINHLREIMNIIEDKSDNNKWRKYSLIEETIRIILDRCTDKERSVAQLLTGQPGEVELYGCCLMAYEAYRNRFFYEAAGIADAAIILSDDKYNVIRIYIYLIAASSMMRLRNINRAKDYFMKAWDMAYPDNLLSPFCEFHRRLRGLVEVCVKNDYPKEYDKIVRDAERFARGYILITEPDRKNIFEKSKFGELTDVEYMIAILAKNGWTNKEIANNLDMSVRTVKYHMTSIFNKLNIMSRQDLSKHIWV